MLKGINQVKDTVKKKINNKGQALVEFVLILPIILMIIFVIIDFSNILYHRNHLEGVLNDVCDVVKNNGSDRAIKRVLNNNIKYNLSYDDGYIEIRLEEDVYLITPFANMFFNNPYKIMAERIVLDE